MKICRWSGKEEVIHKSATRVGQIQAKYQTVGGSGSAPVSKAKVEKRDIRLVDGEQQT